MKITFKHEVKPADRLDNEEIIDILLKNRQIKDIKEFLNPPAPLNIHLTDFGFKREWEKTFKLLQKIKKNDEMVVVYTDYDADGITGGAILWETLYLLGFKVMPYVPHRKKEGYGFSIKGIDAVKKEFNPSLIISVDHGITAAEKIKYAKSLGIDVIVTDHHLKPERLPEAAAAIFHVPALSGSGVAYFFAKEIYTYTTYAVVGHNREILKNNFSSDYLALASIGTIADLVPLIGPSRSLVKYGLEAFTGCKRVGLKHIIKEAGIDGRKITPYEVGFIIAPRINAVGRLEHAIDALRLLCTNNDITARKLASQVGVTNKQRQDLVVKSVEEARLEVEKKFGKKLPKIIILENKNWHEGVIGLIASRIAEEFFRPTIILTESDGFLKGSARSIPSFHITDFLRDNKKYLIDVGGHKGAAGFTMEKEKYKDFCTIVQKSSNKLIKDKDLEKTLQADLKLPITKATLKLAIAMEKLQPFGIGNPQPVFLSRVEILDAKLFGRKNEHVKIYTKDPDINSYPLELVSFYNADLFMKLAPGQIIDVVYNLQIDRWGGSEKVRGKIIIIEGY